MPVYRYRFVGANLSELSKQVPLGPTWTAAGPGVFVDITVGAGAKSDLDSYMATKGYAYESTNPVTTPDQQASAGLTFGSAAGTVCQGNDARLSDTRSPVAHATSHNSGGGDAMAIDAAAGTGSLRTLGATATSACAGNDARLSDTRTPVSHAASHNSGGGDAMAIDAAAGTGSLRTLGATATSACAGNDARLSDARTPVAHTTSHKHGGSDEVATATAAANAIPKAGGAGALDIAWLPTGSTGTTVCIGNDARLSNDRTASGLRTATTVVAVNAATAPTVGQCLKATASTTATWQEPSIRQSLVVNVGGNMTTGTNPPAYADLITQNITMTTVGNALLIIAAFSVSNTNNAKTQLFRVTVDGAVVGNPASLVNDGANLAESGTIVARVTGLAVGARVVKLQWNTSGNTAQCRGLAAPTSEGASLLLIETGP